MDNKMFELMEKMYSEMLGMKKSQDNLQDDICGIKQEIIGVKQEVKQIGIKIEGEVIPKIEALFDGYKQNTERIGSLENKISDMDNKIDDLRLDINSLSVKTINNDNRIIEITRNIRSIK